METPISEQDIEYAETYLAAGDISTASQMLERYLELAEEYIAEECQATDEVQYFSFQDSFERLCYARVEHDPRRIVAVPAPFDRLYSDVAYVCIQQQDYERARDALVQAVRWNPMNCKYRLDLAEIFRALGDIQEWAALSNSVLERASDGRVAARAYSNLGQLFIDQDNAVAASGCARLAVRLAPADARTVALMDRLAKEHPEVAKDSDDHVMGGAFDPGHSHESFGRCCHLPAHLCVRCRNGGGPRPGCRVYGTCKRAYWQGGLLRADQDDSRGR